MNVRKQLNELQTQDIYSLMLFALYKVNELPEYSALSQLSYILDQDNLLRLCKFYGGLTIYIPTIEELEMFLNALFLFQKVNIEHQDYEKALANFDISNKKELEKNYFLIKDLLKDYDFNAKRD